MRIKSNFYDYYDSLASHDRDDITYYRVKKEICRVTGEDTSSMEITYRHRYRRYVDNYKLDDYDFITILFCGFFYKGIKYNEQFFYNPDKFSAEYESLANKRAVTKYCEEKSYCPDYRGDKRYMTEKELVYDKLTNQKRPTKFDAAKYNSPVCYYPGYEKLDSTGHPRSVIILDACLKQIEFFRCVNIVDTYQQIERWLCNQAPGEKPIPVMDDKTMRDIKGFDKYSFRKDKSK